MQTAYQVLFRTGGNLNGNELVRLKEQIAEALQGLAAEYLADLEVTSAWLIEGPIQDKDGT